MPDPIACIAVHAMLCRRDSVLLLRRHNTGYRDGQWSMPAGHVMAGEGLYAAVARELEEETGVYAEPQHMTTAHVIHKLPGDGRTYVEFFVVVGAWTGHVRRNEPDKCSAIKWCTTAEREVLLLTPSTTQALAAISKGQPFSRLYGGLGIHN